MRVAAEEPVTLRVVVGSEEAGTIALPKTSWYEAQITLPLPARGGTAGRDAPASVTMSDPGRGELQPRSVGEARAGGRGAPRVAVDVIALDDHGAPVPPRSREHGPRFASFHYWLFAR
jgi:hypothetical protein